MTAFRFRSLHFRSLKSRLVALTLLVVGSVWIAAAAFTWYEARHEAEEVFDAHLVQAASLLTRTPNPTDQDIDRAMQGNICRCGTYQRIRAAIKTAASGRRS